MIPLLDPHCPDAPFPDVESALREPDGLLALGGDLTSRRLINAYSRGIFPWYSAGQPILWWAPDPRTVLFPERLKVSRSLRKTLRKQKFEVSFDRAFDRIIAACAEPRSNEPGTWITSDMMAAYRDLHRQGIAHSVEVWHGNQLAGGLYGLALGRVFFGESMFSRASDASKVALAGLVGAAMEWGYRLIDCQVYSEHLLSLGAELIPRSEFSRLLRELVDAAPAAAWTSTERHWPAVPGAT